MSPKPSSLALIAANLIPIGGVLWFDWSVFEILLLYWAESVIIGLINVLRMLSCRTDNLLAGFSAARGKLPADLPLAATAPRLGGGRMKTFMIPFFIGHYGVFCFGHLTAVVSIFSGQGQPDGLINAIPPLAAYTFCIAVSAIFLSHLFSFFVNYIGKGEFRRTGLGTLMQRPYGRIVVMHVTIILGAAFVSWLDNPLPMLLVLIAAKTVVDLKLHSREREKFSIHT